MLTHDEIRQTPSVETTALIDPAPRTFFGVPALRELGGLDAQVAFLGVPYDGGTPEPGIPTGQRAGPAAVREASEALFAYPRRPAAGERRRGLVRRGVRPRLPGRRDDGRRRRRRDPGLGHRAELRAHHGRGARVAERGALMVAIGGDHSISYPLGRGMEPLGASTSSTSMRMPTSSTSWVARADRRQPAATPCGVAVRRNRHRARDPQRRSLRDGRAARARGRWATSLDVIELDPARDPSGATSPVTTWILTHFLSEIFDLPRAKRLSRRPRSAVAGMC